MPLIPPGKFWLCLVAGPQSPDLLVKVEQALKGGVNILQLRGKDLPAAKLFELALQIKPLCEVSGAKLIINDRLDVGLAVGADGFQLGTKSLPLGAARKVVGDKYFLGASIHSVGEAIKAARAGADFLVAGTIFPSATHPGGQTSGPRLLKAISRELPGFPVLGIGGITPANAGQVLEAGAAGVAVISGILASSDPEKSALDYQAAANRVKGKRR